MADPWMEMIPVPQIPTYERLSKFSTSRPGSDRKTSIIKVTKGEAILAAVIYKKINYDNME